MSDPSRPLPASPRNPRRIDHCVLPVADLDIARRRYESLGFTVAPVGVHPFGTENACVYFGDGTFLEPLAIGQRETAEEAARTGNVFAARDQAYRFRSGHDGFSALVMRTDDARADDARFREAGISAGQVLDFGRDFIDAGGTAGRVDFRLAFAGDLRSPDAFFFTCERRASSPPDRGALERHANGVSGIAAVVLSEPNPTDFQYLLQEVADQRDVQAHSFGMDVDVPGSTVSVLNRSGLSAWFGLDRGPDRGLKLEAIVFRCASVDTVRRTLASDIASETVFGRLLVRPSSGQGAIFAFQETP